jgi:hypothetical protein
VSAIGLLAPPSSPAITATETIVRIDQQKSEASIQPEAINRPHGMTQSASAPKPPVRPTRTAISKRWAPPTKAIV